MAHPEWEALLEAQVDGTLSPADEARLEAHLAECPECQSRLEAVQREAAALHLAMAPTNPPVGFADAVMIRIQEDRRRPRIWRVAVYAGIAADVLTALVLLILSIGTGASLALMLLLALGLAVVWGGIKGLAFGGSLRYLPAGVLPRGLTFGLAVWIVISCLWIVAGGLGSKGELSPSFVLIGTLVHDLIYGLLISALYAWLSGTRRGRAAAP